MLELILWHVLFAQTISHPPIDTLSDTVFGPLVFVSGGVPSIILTCQAAGPDPEDYYDCKLDQGHGFDEFVRFVMRQIRNLQEEKEKDRQEELKLLQHWRKVLSDIQKQLPHPVPQCFAANGCQNKS